MDHEPFSVSPISVSAGLALLAYQGAEISKVDENQSSFKEDFALAIPEEDAPYSGTEKDGELVLQHSKNNHVSRDFSLDPGTLRYLRDKTFEEGASAQERDRVQHRAKGYYFMNKLLRKRTSPLRGKIDKVVPPPQERTNLIRAIHIEVGHFGVHKTRSLLEPTYFWSGMFAQVRKEVSTSCTVCERTSRLRTQP
jgi:serine protease inhibitor